MSKFDFDIKDGSYKPSSSITYEGVQYLTDKDGRKDGIDFDYYKANPLYETFIKDSKTNDFNSVNDVNNFLTYIEEFTGKSEESSNSDSAGTKSNSSKGGNTQTYEPNIKESTRNPKLQVPEDYEFVSNPRNPSIEDLRYFATEYLVPTYPEGQTMLVEVGQGETARVDKVVYEYRDTIPPKTFEYKGEVFKPREMFLNQNDGLKKTKGKYKKGKIEKFVEETTQMPTFNFALNPVELIKPSYGDVGQTVNKGLMFQSGYKDLKSNQQELFGNKQNFKLEKKEFKNNNQLP